MGLLPYKLPLGTITISHLISCSSVPVDVPQIHIHRVEGPHTLVLSSPSTRYSTLPSSVVFTIPTGPSCTTKLEPIAFGRAQLRDSRGAVVRRVTGMFCCHDSELLRLRPTTTLLSVVGIVKETPRTPLVSAL